MCGPRRAGSSRRLAESAVFGELGQVSGERRKPPRGVVCPSPLCAASTSFPSRSADQPIAAALSSSSARTVIVTAGTFPQSSVRFGR